EKYDVLVLDRRLPDGDGLQLCRDLRDKSIHTPVLLLTARDLRRDILDGLNGGADDYVVKPFDFDELVARIRALARRNVTAHSVVLNFDEIELDTATKRGASRRKAPHAYSQGVGCSGIFPEAPQPDAFEASHNR
ncbi:MAG TPA: response regulator transcription factor, partial [Candidatus Saccharimonadales bacterium]